MHYLPLIIFLLFLSGCGETASPATTQRPAAPPPAEGIVDVNPLNDPTPLAEMITLDGISAGAQIVPPLQLRGKAIGAWYGEGDFPVTIVGEDGSPIASAPAKALGNWRQAGWVPYQATLSWIAGPNTKARLILTLDNPAEAGEGRRRALEIPVVLK